MKDRQREQKGVQNALLLKLKDIQIEMNVIDHLHIILLFDLELSSLMALYSILVFLVLLIYFLLEQGHLQLWHYFLILFANELGKIICFGGELFQY